MSNGIKRYERDGIKVLEIGSESVEFILHKDKDLEIYTNNVVYNSIVFLTPIEQEQLYEFLKECLV